MKDITPQKYSSVLYISETIVATASLEHYHIFCLVLRAKLQSLREKKEKFSKESIFQTIHSAHLKHSFLFTDATGWCKVVCWKPVLFTQFAVKQREEAVITIHVCREHEMWWVCSYNRERSLNSKRWGGRKNKYMAKSEASAINDVDLFWKVDFQKWHFLSILLCCRVILKSLC